MIKKERGICVIDGCSRKGRNKGYYAGAIRWDKVCEFHHKKASAIPEWLKRQPNKKCEVCGWSKSYCDRHRLIPSKGYIKSNVKILCPNCHRLATVGLLIF